MTNGKIRHRNHILGDQAISFIQNTIIPHEWVVRSMNPDYGIDLDLELFEYEDGQCITMGEHVFLQVKGTENPNYVSTKNGEAVQSVIKYSLEVTELSLVERMGSAFPVLLIIVDLKQQQAFHICLNDYINKVLSVCKPNYKDQSTVTINIPVENKLTQNNRDVFLWYGMRIKIYSMFHEMLSDISDLDYMDSSELVEYGKRFVERYISYDVFNKKELWLLLKDIYDMMEHLSNNDYTLDECIHSIQRTLGYKENWEEGTLYVGSSEIPENAYLFAQKMSIRRLTELIQTTSGMFEVYGRQRYMPR